MLRKIRILLLTSLLMAATVTAAFAALTLEQRLGKLLYFDRYLSSNHNQACASCHDISAGFADPLNLRLPELYPVSAGSITTAFGGRNAPPSAYALYSPPFGIDPATGLYVGGQFWDGRAATLKDQAKGPFLNPVEMNMGTMANVVAALKDPANRNAPEYQRLFALIYRINLAAIDPAVHPARVANAYDKAAQAIGEYEKSALFAQFSSKFDAVMAGAESFTPGEANGWALFNGKAQCNLCHPAPLFTDFTYDNLGIPKSTHPMLAANPADLGLGTVVGDPLQDGKFKVSSLRNIDLTPPYGHNGYFATLQDIVHFYNTAGNGSWPAPEVTANVNRNELGNLLLTAGEELDLVAFLKTLTDRFEGKRYAPVIP
ncbi:MAG: cytochrome-c peroxidase [Desulfuromonas sp.]|nr:cytochrome-c peroxidase [Desulfuromonas sp.]